MRYLTVFLSLAVTLLKGWLGRKSIEQKASQTLIDERNKAIYDGMCGAI